jgi:P4 family phage/plasmid primase-like protien
VKKNENILNKVKFQGTNMTSFRKYLLQFVKDTDKHQTHLSFNRGKYNVPNEEYDIFYKKYYEALINGEEDLFLIEKVHNSKFRFFMDLELKQQALSDEDVEYILEGIKQAIKDIFKQGVELDKYIISKREARYHVNFYDLVVDSGTAKEVVNVAKTKIPGRLQDAIDVSVYRTGLRLLGSKKGKKNSDSVYKLYDIDGEKYMEMSYENFKKTIVRVKDEVEKSEVKENFKEKCREVKQQMQVPVRGIENNEIVEEISKFIEAMKSMNPVLGDFNMGIERIYATQNKMGFFCYYVSIKNKKCPFKEREHKRDSYPIYIEINMTGMYVKCYDQDCLRRCYPEEGLKLPSNFENDYPQLYLSMCTRYWKTELTITDEIKRYLEDSLKGSHYQIAKAAFQIYLNRFRIDDVKNVTWYEFDGVRWNKSHAMNILISEELPKYYKGIKISDTSCTKENLKDFLLNDGRMDGNVRNQFVDGIISKLENVNFKNNVLNQLAYLYKTHDSDFYNNLDSNPYLLGFKNGVYDFQQNTFRKGQQVDYITFSTGYDYIEYDEDSNQVQEIYEFLSKIIPNDRVREYMLKVLGKALVGIPDEKFYIWTGISGANGKSTLVNFLEYTLGDYATSVDVSLLTNKRANASNASPDVVRLRGKRLFTFQEPEHDDKLRTGILKQFTGGDTIVARELFKAPVTFKLQGTMLMCCNDLPVVTSYDGGTWRRIRVVEFKSRFCDNPVKDNEYKIDPIIKYKIKEWRPYFMSILIHWYNRYLYEGMDEPDEVKKATTKYKVDNDKFNEFFDQCLEESSTFESFKNIYSNFQSWWSSNYSSTKVPEHKELKRAMKIKYGNEKEKVVNGVVQYGFNVKVHIEDFEDIDSGCGY